MFDMGNTTPFTMPVAPSGFGGGGCGDNFGDNWAWIIIILFALFGGWGNNGYGNGNGGGASPYSVGAATQADLQRGFDTQAVTNKLNGLENGLSSLGYNQLGELNGIGQDIAQLGYGLQNSISQASTANLQNTYALQQAINADTVSNMQNTNALQSQLANCCCENREAIQGVNYNIATSTAALQNTLNVSTRDIVENQNAGTRAILDYLCQDKISSLTQENQALRLSASQQAQNAYIIDQLKPYPVPAFPAGQLYGYMNGSPCCGCN